jgi:hypothetical protein
VVVLVIFLLNVLTGIKTVMKKKFLKGKRNIKKGNKRRNKFFKKSFYSKEDSSSSDKEDNDSDSDSERVLFMEVEDDSEEEGEVDLRAELISALEELRKERKKNKSLKAELKMKEGSQNSNSEELEKMITSLKIQIEEDKRIEEILRSQLEEKEKMIGSLEAEVVSLRKDLQKKDMQQKSTKILDQIISSQRSSDDRSGLGYNQVQNEKGSSSKTTETGSRTKKLCRDCQRFSQEGRMQAPKEEHSRNKEDSRRQIQKECITKKIIYSQVSKILLWSLF